MRLKNESTIRNHVSANQVFRLAQDWERIGQSIGFQRQKYAKHALRKRLSTFFKQVPPLLGGCSEGLDAFRFFDRHTIW